MTQLILCVTKTQHVTDTFKILTVYYPTFSSNPVCPMTQFIP